MGERLIIKNADFSANCIERDSLSISINVENYSLSLVPSADLGYRGSVAATAATRMSATIDGKPVLIPSGATVTLAGLRGVDGNQSPLRVDYVYYRNNDVIPILSNSGTTPNPNAVGALSNGVSSNYYPINTDGSNDAVEITNTHGQDYYFCFAFRGLSNQNIYASNYTITLTYE